MYGSDTAVVTGSLAIEIGSWRRRMSDTSAVATPPQALTINAERDTQAERAHRGLSGPSATLRQVVRGGIHVFGAVELHIRRQPFGALASALSNGWMADDIEQRLATAAEALREYELTARRSADLRRRMDEMTTQLAVLRTRHAGELEDVARLESLSLTRVLASLRGTRDHTLERERAEADAARYRVAEAEGRLEALRRDRDAAQARLSQLAAAPRTYAAVLDDKERHLSESGDPRRGQLLELADERGRLTSEMRELAEAMQAARVASGALSQVRDKLGSASGWSTYDTFFGGGALSSAIKHSRLDEAAQAAAHADRCLAVLRSELADVRGVAVAPNLAVDGLTRFVDVWFDNIFTDLAVRDRIKQAEHNVARSIQLVHEAQIRIDQRAGQTRARLATIETERRELLTRR